VPGGVEGFFDIHEYCSRREVVVKIESHVVRQPHALKEFSTLIVFLWKMEKVLM
jgi:hypothetical protein